MPVRQANRKRRPASADFLQLDSRIRYPINS
jgi:hypothetical protein